MAAIVLPIEANDVETFANPFVLEFLGSVGLALRQHEYNLLLLHEKRIDVQYWNSGLVDGYLQLGHGIDPRFLNELPGDLPLVVWGPCLQNQHYSTVGVDNARLGRQAVEHLIALGRRRIGLIVGTFGNNNTESYLRYVGYREALRAAQIPFDRALVTTATTDTASGYVATMRLMAQAPDVDAVFAAYGDVVALAAIDALRQAGRRVPQDVAVVGFDNISLAMHFGTPLTTVSQEVQSTGAALLVETLMKQIAGEMTESVTIEGKFIVRQSCGAN
ncbi:MAG: substrate-binding domain-containing protein [Chloroflexi bacterium]|nr:substrate-binding domain-containing protein [Chloroflexota bacterium]